MSINAKAVFFDLDGTLIHSAPDIHAAANVVCRSRGWEEFDLKTIASFIGNGVPKLVERVFVARGQSHETSDYDAAVAEFLEYYDAHATDLTAPYPGIIEALDTLKSRGMPMAVITNKPKSPAVIILDDLDLTKYFDVVIGGDSAPAKKPDPAPYLAGCAQMGIEPSDTIYVGDSETDGKTASNVGVRFALYSDGYRNSELSEIPHDVIVDDFADLPKLLAEIKRS